MRSLTFTQIVDSRFDTMDSYTEQTKGELNTLIRERHAILMDLLNSLEGVTVECREAYLIDWDDFYQYRQDYRVQKTTRRVTWDTIQTLVNSIHAVPYRLN